jgi:hypothetical protein
MVSEYYFPKTVATLMDQAAYPLDLPETKLGTRNPH